MSTVSRSGPRRAGVRAAGALLGASALVALFARPAAAGTLLVTDGSKILNYNAQTGAPAAAPVLVPAGSGGLTTALGMAWGPDSNLYVGDGGTGSILEYNGSTGAFIKTFVSAGSGGLSQPESLVFGGGHSPTDNNNLYVASMANGNVLQFSGSNGAFMSTYVPAGTGGLKNPWGLTGRDDNNAYVLDFGGNSVLRYDGKTGAFLNAFVGAGSGGLNGPKGFAFGPDGDLYIASSNSNQILRYNGTTGASMGQFVSVQSPIGLGFGPDENLYVISAASNSILSYSGKTGAQIGTFIPAGSAGLGNPTGLLFLPPNKPTGLTASAVSFSQINLSWTNNSDDATVFGVWRSDANNNWQWLGDVPANTTSFSDTNLPPNASFTYLVRARSAVGPSPWSNSVQVSTYPMPPMAPSNLVAMVMSANQINLSWNANPSDETAYSVWRKSLGGTWSRIAALPAKSNNYTDNNVMPNTVYTYKVRAVNPFYASEWSNEASGWTPLIPPARPTDLAANVVSSTQINLTWNEDATYAFAITVWRQTGTGAWTRIAVLSPTATSYSDTTVTTGTSYAYKIQATNDDFVSDWSNETDVATP